MVLIAFSFSRGTIPVIVLFILISINDSVTGRRIHSPSAPRSPKGFGGINAPQSPSSPGRPRPPSSPSTSWIPSKCKNIPRLKCPLPENERRCNIINDPNSEVKSFKPKTPWDNCCPVFNCSKADGTEGYHMHYILKGGDIPQTAQAIANEKGMPDGRTKCPKIKCRKLPVDHRDTFGLQCTKLSTTEEILNIKNLGNFPFKECCDIIRCAYADDGYYTHFEIQATNFFLSETSFYSGEDPNDDFDSPRIPWAPSDINFSRNVGIGKNKSNVSVHFGSTTEMPGSWNHNLDNANISDDSVFIEIPEDMFMSSTISTNNLPIEVLSVTVVPPLMSSTGTPLDAGEILSDDFYHLHEESTTVMPEPTIPTVKSNPMQSPIQNVDVDSNSGVKTPTTTTTTETPIKESLEVRQLQPIPPIKEIEVQESNDKPTITTTTPTTKPEIETKRLQKPKPPPTIKPNSKITKGTVPSKMLMENKKSPQKKTPKAKPVSKANQSMKSKKTKKVHLSGDNIWAETGAGGVSGFAYYESQWSQGPAPVPVPVQTDQTGGDEQQQALMVMQQYHDPYGQMGSYYYGPGHGPGPVGHHMTYPYHQMGHPPQPLTSNNPNGNNGQAMVMQQQMFGFGGHPSGNSMHMYQEMSIPQ